MLEPTSVSTSPTPQPAPEGRARRASAPESPGPSSKTSSAPEPAPGPKDAGTERPDGHRNEVFVVGRVTAVPAERELPSGDRLVTWRIGVARTEVSGPRRARADSLTLVSFDPHLCDRVHEWRIGDVVRVTGALRRRFWHGWNGVRSVLEVEVGTAALVRRAEG